MEIQPASLPKIETGRGGRVVFIDDDALDIAKELAKIDLPEDYGSLRLGWNEFGEYFVVVQVMPSGEEQLVTVWDPELNGQVDYRLIERVKKVIHPSYDIAKELEKIDKAAEKAADRKFQEQVGDYAERLASAVRKDIGATNRIFVPGRTKE